MRGYLKQHISEYRNRTKSQTFKVYAVDDDPHDLDDNGAIASVTVGENSETEGIGSKAIEQLPEQFVGLLTAEEIDAVDGVSGATITSNAIKSAIKEAMGL